MPITFSVTCDTDEELARFLENLRYGKELSQIMQRGEGAKSATATASTVTKESASAEPQAPARGRKPAVAPKSAGGKNKTKAKAATPAKPAKQANKKTAPAAKAAEGKKTGKLIPLIQNAINDMVKKGKPFRSREVTEMIMRKAPDLNESSVTTGVSKLLSESSLDWEQIKDAVGRPYKLYKP